jgi:hypothetical protein
MSRVADKKQSFIQATFILYNTHNTHAHRRHRCEKHNANQSNDIHDARIHVEQTLHRPS